MMRADRSHSVDWIGAVCRAAEREIPRSDGTCRSQAADDQHQWAIALPRPLPAPHQNRDFFLTPDERREMALSCVASATARTYKPKQHYQL